jgi:L-lysine 2,3-aminomutase
VLITGGDALVLPNAMLRWLLEQLDAIDHLKVKRLGTRIPVTAPMRIDDELLDILEESNDRKAIRVVTQINTAQEITPVSRDLPAIVEKDLCRAQPGGAAQGHQRQSGEDVEAVRDRAGGLCPALLPLQLQLPQPAICSFPGASRGGRDLIESMYGNISGDAIPRYIATAGGKIPLHRSNVMGRNGNQVVLRKPWSEEEVSYPDADPEVYADAAYSFNK